MYQSNTLTRRASVSCSPSKSVSRMQSVSPSFSRSASPSWVDLEPDMSAQRREDDLAVEPADQTVESAAHCIRLDRRKAASARRNPASVNESSDERLLVPGDHDRNVPALRRPFSRVASRHTREGLPGSPKDGDRAVRVSVRVSNGLSAECRIAFLPVNIGAGERTRTADLLITNQLLYQLSYAGSLWNQ